MVLVTGDCVHAYPLDEGFEPEGEDAYRLLRGLVEARFAAATVRAVPGNHDSRAALSAVFPESLGGGAAPAPPEGLHCFAELCEGWLVLGCDSQSGDPLDPASEGDMSPPQLAWVRSVVSTPLHRHRAALRYALALTRRSLPAARRTPWHAGHHLPAPPANRGHGVFYRQRREGHRGACRGERTGESGGGGPHPS
eukprot:COSAG04_NODE_235_length_19140_cov_47.925109_18_plen_195_part_00